mmetsp:Transcript_33296/g.79849  ORF Transcript_33296/g.79849 Transcript_33296/m.79849 type:complete len:258 (-) Transcript_33296:834-1607(-)
MPCTFSWFPRNSKPFSVRQALAASALFCNCSRMAPTLPGLFQALRTDSPPVSLLKSGSVLRVGLKSSGRYWRGFLPLEIRSGRLQISKSEVSSSLFSSAWLTTTRRCGWDCASFFGSMDRESERERDSDTDRCGAALRPLSSFPCASAPTISTPSGAAPPLSSCCLADLPEELSSDRLRRGLDLLLERSSSEELLRRLGDAPGLREPTACMDSLRRMPWFNCSKIFSRSFRTLEVTIALVFKVLPSSRLGLMVRSGT